MRVCELALLGDDIINCNNLTPQNHGDCIRTLTAASCLGPGSVVVSPGLYHVYTLLLGGQWKAPLFLVVLRSLLFEESVFVHCMCCPVFVFCGVCGIWLKDATKIGQNLNHCVVFYLYSYCLTAPHTPPFCDFSELHCCSTLLCGCSVIVWCCVWLMFAIVDVFWSYDVQHGVVLL